jgi:hypothetical protein
MAKRPTLKRRSITEQVGYGQPPLHSRFEKGRSGNPRGRPKGSRNLKSIILKRLFSLVDVRENGKSRRIPLLEAIFVKSSNDALQGRLKAFIDIFKLLQGANLFPLEELEDRPTPKDFLNSSVTVRIVRPDTARGETSSKSSSGEDKSELKGDRDQRSGAMDESNRRTHKRR